MPWRVNPLVPDAVRQFQADHLHGSNGVEQTQVMGYTVIGLALVGIIWFLIKEADRLLPTAQALLAQLEWRIVHSAMDAMERYLETVVLPAVQRAEKSGG